MGQFLYVIKDSSGKTIKDVTDAASEDALASQFQSRGYFIVSIEAVDNEASKSSLLKSFSSKTVSKSAKTNRKFSHTGVKLPDLVVFSRQLATMLESGVPLLRSLDVILAQIESKKFYETMKQVRDEVEQGSTLSSCLAKHPKVFTQFWSSLVEVGEASGSMPMVLDKLASHMEEQAEFSASLKGALMYPMILLGICVLALLAFALFVGPRFESIFQSMGKELPPITQFVLTLFKVIKTKFVLIIGGCVGIKFAFDYWVKTDGGRQIYENILFNLPNVGKVYKLVIVENFASQMAILINSGVPILYALEIAEKLVDNKTCGAYVVKIRDSVREGSLLSDPMAETGFFPNMAVQMIKVGEETGELGKMLGHVSRFYKKEVKEFMANLSTMLEPIMLLFMAVLMGTIVIAMFMPMFELSSI